MRAVRFLIFTAVIFPMLMSFSFFSSKEPDHVVIAKKIRASVAKNLCQKHRMSLIGEGGGMMGSVYIISLSFEVNRLMDRDEARERIVDCVEELLSAVNQSKEIRPYLKNYPFTVENVDMAIFIKDKNGRSVYDPNICVVSVYQSNEITFSTNEPNQYKYKNEYCESYQEALAKVRNQSLKDVPQAFEPPIIIPTKSLQETFSLETPPSMIPPS